jgi:FolB domain-containing protein
MMKLEIENLEIAFFLGFYPEEKIHKTNVIFNIILEFDDSEFLKTRDFKDLIDYDILVQKIKKAFHGARYNLIEDVILKVRELLLEYPVKQGEIKISKQGTHANLQMISISKKISKEF